MPRKKKEETENLTVAPNISFARDEKGLLSGVEHQFNSYGLVDWRKMVDPQHVVLNKYTLARKKGLDLDLVSADDKKKLIENATEDELLIKLQGFKDVARLRGIKSMDSELLERSSEVAVVKVTIEWLPNFEDPQGKTVSCIKNASMSNVNFEYASFLEALAENRAFSTAVRNSLCIPIVGYDEIDNSQKPSINDTIAATPQYFLSVECSQNGISFETLKQKAKGLDIIFEEDWKEINSISTPMATSLLHELKCKN